MVPAVLESAGVDALLEADQLGVLDVAGDERVDLEIPEPAGEANVLGGRDGLVAEHQDLVVEQRPPDLGDHPVGKLGPQVHPADLGAQRRSLGRDADIGERRAGQPGSLLREVQPRAEVETVPVYADPSGHDAGRGVGGSGLLGAAIGSSSAVACHGEGGSGG